MTGDAVAHRLSGHIDELARALAQARAPEPEAARLLELAALAAMHAVTLAELGADEPEEPAPRVEAPPVQLRAAA